VLSSLSYALIDLEQEALKIKPSYQAHWFNIDELPDLIFVHPEMVDFALKTLRHTASTKPVSFNLLPEKFTLLKCKPCLKQSMTGLWINVIFARN
jgi:hypothetical protein